MVAAVEVVPVAAVEYLVVDLAVQVVVEFQHLLFLLSWQSAAEAAAVVVVAPLVPLGALGVPDKMGHKVLKGHRELAHK